MEFQLMYEDDYDVVTAIHVRELDSDTYVMTATGLRKESEAAAAATDRWEMPSWWTKRTSRGAGSKGKGKNKNKNKGKDKGSSNKERKPIKCDNCMFDFTEGRMTVKKMKN